ncbi:MAG: serine/threonine protein kinase [Verrucomicrobiales bacterium]|nr:serine/threonine protein kinase [Verrucomicrobiales bacterium]
MKSRAAFLLPVCAAVFAGAVLHGSGQLPDRVATHFGGNGAPDGWMDKSSFVPVSMTGGLGMPLLMMGLLYLVRFLPAKFLNVPHAAYWREPGNHRRACGILFSFSLWAASAFLLWQAALFYLIVTANRSVPPHLNTNHVILLTVALLAFTAVWTMALMRHFLKTPE